MEKEIQPDNTAVISIDAYNGCQLQCPYCFQMNDPAWCGQIQVRTNIADVLKNDLQEAGIPVRLFLTPVLPDIMDVDEMVAAIPQGIPVYLDKLRVFDKESQNEKIYEWVKAHYPAYTEHYRKILFEADEGYYADLTQKYQNDPRITFMSELWKEDQ